AWLLPLGATPAPPRAACHMSGRACMRSCCMRHAGSMTCTMKHPCSRESGAECGCARLVRSPAGAAIVPPSASTLHVVPARGLFLPAPIVTMVPDARAIRLVLFHPELADPPPRG